MQLKQKITPFLWFSDQAEQAMHHYVSIFPGSRIVSITRYAEGPMKGKVLTGVFELAGQQFLALDGGPQFRFTEAISLFVQCETQAEVDELWVRLSQEGDPKAQQCGWLKDKYGLSWQIIPTALPKLLNDHDPARSKRVMEAMLQMKKIDIQGLQRAYEAA